MKAQNINRNIASLVIVLSLVFAGAVWRVQATVYDNYVCVFSGDPDSCTLRTYGNCCWADCTYIGRFVPGTYCEPHPGTTCNHYSNLWITIYHGFCNWSSSCYCMYQWLEGEDSILMTCAQDM